MAFKTELVRPDDLLHLRIDGVNLKIATTDPASPVLVVADPQQPAYLTFTFPPQTIAEGAYFEYSIVQPAGNPQRPDSDASATGNEPLDPPGQVKAPRRTTAQLAHPSRLVFKVPADARIPFSTQGLLDWSKLELSVSPIAAMPPNPTPQQIANAPSIQPPAANETALELPYRLVISPNRDVVWEHRKTEFTSHGRTELWHTRLALKTNDGVVELSREQRAPLRAIWSPDYTPNKPPDPSATNKPETMDRDLWRTAMDANDRYQIVILTSAFRGYEVDVEITLLGIAALGERFVTRPERIPFNITVPYVPAPFEAEQLMLSALGGWLRSRGHWTPPRTAKPISRPRLDLDQIFKPRLEVLQPLDAADNLAANVRDEINIGPIFPGLFVREPEQLDLSEWVHVATQGRDHYVRIVYEGELWPFRHRAALIKVTERKFKETSGIVGAYQMQHMFIVVREPVKFFAKTDHGNLLKRVQLTTLVTPDIADPQVLACAKRSFWVEVMTSNTTRALFMFHGVGTDVGGNQVDFTIPMIFVSLMDVNKNFACIATEYNKSKTSQLLNRRNLVVPGQKLLFAERDATKPNDNPQLVTQALNFVMDESRGLPKLLKAEVKVPQVQELLGTDAPTTIRLYENYVKNGLDNATGVFAEIVKEDFSQFTDNNPFAGMIANTLGVTFSSDKAGGFATPNLAVSTLSRALGPLAGKVEDAVKNEFDPQTFFKKGLAMLFGSFDLSELLPKSNGGASTLDKNAPKLRTETKDIAGGKLLRATLDWEPDVKDLDLGIAAFKKDRGGKTTKLLIHGVIEKPIKLGAPPSDGATYEFNGTLNDFQVSVLKSVFINFVAFGFVARTNQKPDVSVKLDSAKPIEFGGDLAFVEELRKAIPPNLFGKGPSLDVSPTGIRAGFAFALPPIAVGVFALKDVSLGAALTLPFLDGKPLFDFNVSERPHPFLLTVSLFGGGGFFHLQLDTAGIKSLEAAFEFGAAAAIDIGVASGEVHIMAGIYFAMQRKENSTDLAAVLSGYLRMGGSLSVLGLVKVSVEFNLSFTYDSVKDKAYGRATLTVNVEVLGFSKSVELTVERAFGGKSGDPKFKELFTTAESWSDYALAFA